MPRTVLLVEDSPDMRTLLRHILTDAGYDLVEATCGAEASDHLAQGGIDVLLLDHRLPDTTGLELLTSL
ncbi:MAG: response regulator, partial [Candidatus Thermoplasmatota archaeon]|nr:response regulator [Candidatus Thermoplasmatota archaeon]